jgi:hypothetical protein
MKRTAPAFLFLVAFGFVSAACGSGGSASPKPLGSSPGNERPSAAGWDPLAPSTETPGSNAETPGCAGQTTATASQVLQAIRGPLCTLATRCFGTSSSPDTPSQANNEGVGISGGCEQIFDLDDIEDQVDLDGPAGVCQLFDIIIERLQAHPECDPPLHVKEGLCLDAVTQCVDDIVAQGCNMDEDRTPGSCKGLSFGYPEDDPVVGPGGSGQGGAGPGGSGGFGEGGSGGFGEGGSGGFGEGGSGGFADNPDGGF